MEKFIYSGEIHYFRIKPKLWKTILLKAKKSGINTVSTYIPWRWHEQVEGEFDFEGKSHPQKNLVLYLELIKYLGLKVILRIGPVTNAELKNEGIPDWLIEKYPYIFHRGNGIENLPHTILLNYLDPVFLNFAKRWYKKLLPVVKKWDRIIEIIQIDNEIGMSHWVNKTPELSPQTEKSFQNFLKKKFKKISKLNSEIKSSFKNFNEICQKNFFSKISTLSLLQEFYQEYSKKYFSILKKIVRGYFPYKTILVNIPQFIDFDTRARGFEIPVTTQLFKKIACSDKKLIFGGAYQLRRIDWENFHDVSLATDFINFINPYKKNICAELQTGIMRDRPKIYPEDVEFHLKTALASGIKGINCYMFSGGENPEGMGLFGKYHDWQAPLDPIGKEKPHLEPIKEMGCFLKTFGKSLLKSKKQICAAIGFYPPYFSNIFSNFPQLENARNRYFFDGIARLLLLNNIHFEIIDIENGNLPLKQTWIFSWKWMDEKTQKKILKFVKQGGRVVIGPSLPQFLLKKLNIKKSILHGNSTALSNGIEYFCENFVELYKGVFDKILTEHRKGVCAFLKRYGRGFLLCYGFPITSNYNYFISLIKKWAEILEIKKPFETDTNEIIFTMHTTEKGKILFAFNFHNIFIKTNLKIRNSFYEISFFPKQLKILPLNFKISKDKKIAFSTATILKFTEEKILISGCNGESGFVEIEKKGKKVIKKFKLAGGKKWIKI